MDAGQTQFRDALARSEMDDRSQQSNPYESPHEAAMEQQAKAALALGLLIFVTLIGLAIAFSGSLSNSIRN